MTCFERVTPAAHREDCEVWGGERERPVRSRRFRPNSQSVALTTGPGSWADIQILRPRPQTPGPPGQGWATWVCQALQVVLRLLGFANPGLLCP